MRIARARARIQARRGDERVRQDRADEAHLVVRAPLYLFKAVKFPVKGAEIDVDNSAPAVERALAGLQKEIMLFENGRPLGRSARDGATVAAVRSLVRNLRAGGEPCRDADRTRHGIVVDQGYVDAHLTYPISSPDSVFSLRTTAAPGARRLPEADARYLPPTGDDRAMVITSRSGTVALNPTWVRAAAGSPGSASRTSSTASTTCSSCFAW